MTVSNLNTALTPFRLFVFEAQIEQSIPFICGLPQTGQKGCTIRGNFCWQEMQIRSPSSPQPRHFCGKKKSSAALFRKDSRGSTFTTFNIL
jgi:hypothetical protein